MISHRDALKQVSDDRLVGKDVTVRLGKDSRRYQLDQLIGAGKAGVAWCARDAFSRTWAIKFVLQQDYKTHSLDAEAQRVNSLTTRRIANIDFFGSPTFDDSELDADTFYAVVVQWIHGIPLRDYLTDHGTDLTVHSLLGFARTLCEVLADLQRHQLSHNDLHDMNIIVEETIDPLTRDTSLDLMVIDTGALKSEERRLSLIDSWQSQLATLQDAATESGADLSAHITTLQGWIAWFSRTDQEWVVSHLCALSNCLVHRVPDLDVQAKHFLHQLADTFSCMVDADRSRRLDDPLEMYRALEHLWISSCQLDQPRMTSPFDRMYAELIHSDRQLMDLFSEEFPGLAACRSTDPVYLYGPRGCGKSTVLRSMSLKAILNSASPYEDLQKCPFVGVYISCSSELRSRFWLMPPADYDTLEPHIVRYFSLLLIEELVDTLDIMLTWDSAKESPFTFGVTGDVALAICNQFRKRLGISEIASRHFRASPLSILKLQISRERDRVWTTILDRSTPAERTNAQLVFDLCQDLVSICPSFEGRLLVFLVDDYSNQRIPAALQRKLNQAITFAKQGTPIFKVTSEYGGVDLAGVQEGREVLEVNVGLEYVDLTDTRRWRFLRNVLEKRFAYLGCPIDALAILPLSRIGPSTIPLKLSFYMLAVCWRGPAAAG